MNANGTGTYRKLTATCFTHLSNAQYEMLKKLRKLSSNQSLVLSGIGQHKTAKSPAKKGYGKFENGILSPTGER